MDAFQPLRLLTYTTYLWRWRPVDWTVNLLLCFCAESWENVFLCLSCVEQSDDALTGCLCGSASRWRIVAVSDHQLCTWTESVRGSYLGSCQSKLSQDRVSDLCCYDNCIIRDTHSLYLLALLRCSSSSSGVSDTHVKQSTSLFLFFIP